MVKKRLSIVELVGGRENNFSLLFVIALKSIPLISTIQKNYHLFVIQFLGYMTRNIVKLNIGIICFFGARVNSREVPSNKSS